MEYRLPIPRENLKIHIECPTKIIVPYSDELELYLQLNDIKYEVDYEYSYIILDFDIPYTITEAFMLGCFYTDWLHKLKTSKTKRVRKNVAKRKS